MYIRDGHIHTPYCPHGSADSLKKYIERGIELGYSSMTFTEHAPLPESFIDPVPAKDSGMKREYLEPYIEELTKLKRTYRKDLEIKIGLEIDFIEGYEEETKRFLDEWGKNLDDAVLSVHFLKLNNKNEYICLDYSPDSFQALINQLSGIEKVYEKYYETLIMSIKTDLGKYKPDRIGHITLARKFQRLFPRNFDDSHLIEATLKAVKEQEYTLDINGAGLDKPHCLELYPPEEWVTHSRMMGIKLIYGSDAHRASQLGKGIEQLNQLSFFSASP